MTGKKKLLWIGAATFVLLAAIVILLLLQPSDARLSLSPEDVQLQIGQTQQFQILSEEGKTQKLSAVWSSQSDVVATVDENGLVTAVAAGETRITAQVKHKGKEYSLSAIVTVIAPNQADKVTMAGDATPEKPDFEGKCFTVYSATNGVAADMDAGTIQFSDEVKQTEVFFADSMNYPHSDAWELRGTINRENINQTLFLSFGVKDESGKDQWFCLYGTGLSRQRYWNWADTKYDIDNVHVGYNQAAASFYKRDAKADGNRLDFIAVLKDDVLKVYFGNRQEEMSLAWSLPLTKDIFGGFAAGSKYQLGINTVDPCNFAITDLSCKNGQEVQDLGGIVGGKYADIKVSGDKFKIADSSIGVSYNGKQGTVDVKQTVKETVTFFAANEGNYADRWEFSGTIEKEKLSDTVFLSFGVRDSSGKTQWFCIYQNTLSLQKNWDWNETKQKVDGTYVKFNQPACSFFWREKDMGAEKLHYKLILHDDVLTVYFGNDKYPLSQAWNLPLTQDTYGGFKAGSGYQIGIATVDPLNMHIKDIVVNNGDQAAQIPEFTEDGRFYIANQTVNVTDDPVAGTLDVADDPDKSEIIFAASPYDVDSKSWQLTGTVTKAEMENLFLSFGVKDKTGKEQWFCIYQKGLARQRYYNWADTKYDIDGKYVFANPASEHFFYKTPSLGGDKLHYVIIVQDDILKAYFGNDLYDMTLAWYLPLTEELWGGFAPGTEYQLGINSVDPCLHTHTDVSVVTGDAVNDVWYKAQLYNVSAFENLSHAMQEKMEASAKDNMTTVFIGDSFFHQDAFFNNFSSIYRNKEAVCVGISTTTTYHWESFTQDWLKDYDPKNIVVNVGTNNLILQPPYNGVEYVTEGLQTLLSMLKDKFPGAHIYWFSIAPRNDLNREDDKALINAAMKQWCDENGVTYVESPITDPNTDCVDGLHPTEQTYEKYAQALTAAGCEIAAVNTSGYQFFVDTNSTGVTAKPIEGTITISDSASKTETLFAADAENIYSKSWQLTGTVTKAEMKNLFLSFGIRDENGKDQWFCIYQKGLARQRYYNWADTKYDIDGKYVFANPATEHFFYKTPSLGGDKLHFKLVLRDDVLKAYFGNDQYEMTLAWEIPLTEELWGGFTAGSKYQLGINTVDPCAHSYTNVQVLTGDAVPEEEKPDYSNYKFFVDSASGGVTADPEASTIAISNSVSKTETIFKANAEETYSEKWQLTGTVTKTEMKNLFLSFGIRDENGKEQWLCIYNKGLSRQRYWNWADTKYDIDGKYVFANPASEHFFYKTPSLGGDKLHYKLVLRNDVLKAYFGNDQFDMTLAWELPLTEELWGGFTAGSKYQLGINTVDPCAHNHSNVQVLTGDAVVEEIPEEKPDNNRFHMDTATNGVTANQEAGTITIVGSVSQTETMFKANADETHSDKWQLTGTVTKTEIKNLFLSFGIRDENGKEQWFCIYQKGLARQRYWNWANTKQDIDGVHVFANPASEHFFYKTPSLGGDKLHFKLVLDNDVLQAYFGNDMYEMTLAWELPLTEKLWGGFAAGSKYQLGINTVDPCAHTYTNVEILTGDAVTDEETETPEEDQDNNKFYVDSVSGGVTADQEAGTITISNSVSKTETMFKANAEETYSDKWQLTGTVTKTEIKNLFLSFGIRDENGKEQWFCIYQKGLARQRYWNWANTKQDIDGVYVFANPASEHFFYKTPSLGGDKLHFKLVLDNDVLQAYFGNDLYEMTLAWELPLTEELWGGFAAGSKYQLGINTVDPCAHIYTNVEVLTGDGVTQSNLSMAKSVFKLLAIIPGKESLDVTEEETP